MEIKPTPDQEEFIRQAIATGRLTSSEAAAHEAMALWESRERRRLEILAAVDEAEASLERGEGVTIPVDQLIGDVKQRGLARLARERKAD